MSEIERDRNDTPMWIAQRCKWALEDAEKSNDNPTLIRVLRYCLYGAPYGRKPAYIKPEPMSNTVRFFNSLEEER
jgi:hypothetical protein